MARRFPQSMQVILTETHGVDPGGGWASTGSGRQWTSMGVIKQQPAAFGNLVLLMPSMPTRLFLSMAAFEYRYNKGHMACKVENIYCTTLYRKQFARSSLGEIRAGCVCFKLRLAKEELGC